MNWTDEDIMRRNREVLGMRTTVMLHSEMSPSALDYGAIAELKPEWMIEAECTKLLEEDGWRALRTDPVSDRSKGKGFGEVGMADHMYIRYHYHEHFIVDEHPGAGVVSEVIWIEFKSAKGKPQSNQIDWHTKERARGALTLIAGVDFPPSIEGFKTWYKASGLQRNG